MVAFDVRTIPIRPSCELCGSHEAIIERIISDDGTVYPMRVACNGGCGDTIGFQQAWFAPGVLER